MDSSLATLTAQPYEFRHGGKVYLIHPLRIEDYGKMQAWCDSRQPNPYASVSEQLNKGLFTVAQEKALLEAAIRVAMAPKPRIGTPECDALIGSPEGVVKILQIAISRGDPKFTEEQAASLVNSLDEARLAELTNAMQFETMIGGRSEDDPAPKAGPGGNSSTPP